MLQQQTQRPVQFEITERFSAEIQRVNPFNDRSTNTLMVRYRPALVALDRGIHDGSMGLFSEIGISTRVQRSGSIQLHERH